MRQALASDDASGLRDVIRRYEATRAGLAAIIALADRALQRGHPAEARLLLTRIPHLHPDAIADSESLRARMRLAAERDYEAGGPAPDPAPSPAPGSALPGKTARAVPNLERPMLDWPMLGGNATRTRAASAILERAGGRIAEPEREPAYEVDLAIHERISDRPIQPDRGLRACVSYPPREEPGRCRMVRDRPR